MLILQVINVLNGRRMRLRRHCENTTGGSVVVSGLFWKHATPESSGWALIDGNTFTLWCIIWRRNQEFNTILQRVWADGWTYSRFFFFFFFFLMLLELMVQLLQAVQHDGLCAIEQTTDSENWNTHTHTQTHRQPHTHTHKHTHNGMSQLPSNAWNNYPPFIFQFY